MTPDRATSGDSYLAWVREALRLRCGLRSEDVADATLERALRSAAGTAGAPLDELVERIRTPAGDGGLALQHLLRKITVGETSFFRHPEDVDWLRTRVLPALVARRERDGSRRLRLWSAGCATGEEAYTLAMLALEAVPSSEWEIQVIGSDINDESLSAARTASYGEWSFRGVEPELRERWFEKKGGTARDPRWTPIASVRSLVEFQYVNLRDPIYPSIFTRTTELDLVACRNVFLYFFPEAIRTCLERFAQCIVDDGFVLCGPADLFQVGVPPRMSEDGAGHRLRAGAPAKAAARPVAKKPPPSPVRARLPVASPLPAPPPGKSSPPTRAPAEPKDLVRLLFAGDYSAAVDAARAELVRTPLSVEVARCLALALSALGDAGAKDAWSKVLYLDATDPGAHFALGMVLLKEQRRSEAKARFRAVVRLLRDADDDARLPGPDALPVSWVRSACRSLAGDGGSTSWR